MVDQLPNSRASAGQNAAATQHRATKLFFKIIRAYHIRQYIFPHLTATEAAKLIHATKIDHMIGRQERAKVLNPMRNLFTNDELDEIHSQLASDPNRHILVVGRDLENLYARVANADKLDSGIPLLLSIVETTICEHSTASEAELSHLVRNESQRRAESTSSLPGKWVMGPQEARVGSFISSRDYSEVSEEKRDIRDRRIRLRRRKLEFEYTRPLGEGPHGRNVFEHLTNKGLMTMLKGNIQQSLGKANRLTTVAGTDSNGFTGTVLDNMIYVDMQDPVLKRAINSGRTRREAATMRQIRGACIAIPLKHENDCWYIPLGKVDVLETGIA